ncbi:zinc finger protein 2 [Trypanosoma grayi]|uniref:zinc finger protein 2 n=1 Tax=Trypanosoma grayi TaxID=71804 RepID=UPI0004F44FA4|nr:zinc finger protein 2 [Trypanosoma grayi]KEG12849.1 zinc finger protein 2 [Trypanosoma grayi]
MSYPQRYDRGAVAPYGSMQLPIGWQMAYSPEGDPYYIDHNTRTTHWQIPPEVMQRMNQGSGYRVGRVRRGIDRTKLKTKMCMNIQNGGKCTWGDYCAFAHNSEELSAVPHGGNRGGDGNPYRVKQDNIPGNNNSPTANINTPSNGNGAANYMDVQKPQQPVASAHAEGAVAPQQ